jgi:plastocyanin
MKKLYILLIIALVCSYVTISAKTYSIVNSGYKFSPDTLTVKVGDTVVFTLGSIHGVTQVSKSVYNAGGNTLISGGYKMAVGALTGKYVFTSADPDTFYYVCPPHAAGGMKGKIFVKHATVASATILKPMQISVYPNPAIDFINLKFSVSESTNVIIDLIDITGRNVQNLMLAKISAGDYYKSISLNERLTPGRYFVQYSYSGGSFAVPLIIYGKR